MAQAIEQLGKVQVEIAQEGIHGDAIGQGDAEQSAVLANPAVQRGDLAVDQPWAELLVGHDPLVGHGAQRLDIQFPCQVDVAGADEACREIIAQHPYHLFLDAAGEAPAGAEIGYLQLGQFIGAGMRLQPVELAIELIAGIAQAHAWVQVAVAHLADDRQERHFEQHHMQPRAAQAQAQLVVLDAQAQVAQVEAEQPQKAQKSGLRKLMRSRNSAWPSSRVISLSSSI